MLTAPNILKLFKTGSKLPLATKNYPSRGQTSIQDLHQTTQGKFFLKQSSKRNHDECQIDAKTGSLAEREYWAWQLSKYIGLKMPHLWLTDKMTTIQVWLDYPDARTFATSQGKMAMKAENIFDCALFDWLTGQIDRHDANYLYDYVNQEVILIDSAHCFLKYSGSIPDYLKYFEIGFPKELNKTLTTKVLIKINSLTPQKIKRLVPLKNKDELQALEKRLAQLKNIVCIADLINLYREKK